MSEARNYRLTRRRFMATSAAVAGGLMLTPGAQVRGANDRIRVGIVGCGGRGKGNVGWVNEVPGVSVVAVCDPDTTHMDQASKDRDYKKYQDYRDLLADDSIDAVVIATPNHWHALATIMACQAGKDVYVEKPASHSIWEGRKMVEAARKYNRIVQVGTQHRSDPAMIAAREAIANKELGEVQWAHSLWYAHRGPIGKVSEPQPVPDHINYDLWAGPRPTVPVMRNRFHYDWHWLWDYGNGDMGNRVIHVVDDIHHLLQMGDDVPTRMMSVGGRFKYDDDANTPNTQMILMDWKVPIIFGSRNLPHVDDEGRERGTASYHAFGRDFRFSNLIKCEGGYIAVSRGGGELRDNAGERVRNLPGDGGRKHIANFFEACRSRDIADLNADIEGGHQGCLLLHTGNISQRVGRPATTEAVEQQISGYAEASEAWQQKVEHLRANDVNLEIEKPTLGPWLNFDPQTERFVGDHAEQANKLVREEYRKPFEITDEV